MFNSSSALRPQLVVLLGIKFRISLRPLRPGLPFLVSFLFLASALQSQNACPDGSLWRDQLGGVFFTSHQGPGDPPFTDKWSADVAPSYVHFFTPPPGIISASLTVKFAGVADSRGPWNVLANGVVIGQIPVNSSPNAFQEVRTYTWQLPIALITAAESIVLSINVPAINDGYSIDYSELTINGAFTVVSLLGDKDCFGLRSPTPTPVTITTITANQAVDAIDINGDGIVDLVAERPTHVTIATQVSGGNDGDPAVIKVSFVNSANQEEVVGTTSTTLGALRANSVLDFFFTPSSVTGQGKLVAAVQGGSNKDFPIDTKAVRSINISYYKVDYLATVPDYDATLTDSSDYLQAVYPVAPSHFANQSSGTFSPAPAGYLKSVFGAEDDAMNLWLNGRLITLFAPERVVGIVPKDWFLYHQLGQATEGIHFPMVNSVAFVLDNRPLVTAHELGHSYGFGEGYVLNPDGTCCSSDGQPTSGYWVQRHLAVPNSIDYMGDSLGAVPYPSTVRWTTQDGFRTLFQQFRKSSSDPEVLLVTGTITQAGTATFRSMYRVANGTVSQQPAGDGAIRVLDASGNVLATVSFAVDFSVQSDPPTVVTAAPFAFSIPFPAGAVQVAVLRGGQVLARVAITTKLLLDAVESIPDAGFVKNPSETRNALENKIGALDRQLSGGDEKGAINNLRNDIRKQLVDWLVDNYATQTPQQYTKAAVLALVDELLQRLAG